MMLHITSNCLCRGCFGRWRWLCPGVCSASVGGFSPGCLGHAGGFSPGCCGGAWLQLACLGIKVVRQRFCLIVDTRLRPYARADGSQLSGSTKQKNTNKRLCPVITIIIPILITRLCPISRGFARDHSLFITGGRGEMGWKGKRGEGRGEEAGERGAGVGSHV